MRGLEIFDFGFERQFVGLCDATGLGVGEVVHEDGP